MKFVDSFDCCENKNYYKIYSTDKLNDFHYPFDCKVRCPLNFVVKIKSLPETENKKKRLVNE